MRLELSVKFRLHVREFTTHLSANQCSIGLFGKSGAGKSAVLALLAGTVMPHSGRIVLNDRVLFDSQKGIALTPEQRPVGAVLQTESVGSLESVRSHLTAAQQRVPAHRRLFSLDFLVGLLELETLLDQAKNLLSVGERQRVALAYAILKVPELLVLDETFAAIGNAYRLPLLPILKRLQQERGVSVIYASHSLGEILGLTDQLVVLQQSKVVYSGCFFDVAQRQDLLQYLGIRQLDNILTLTIRKHDHAAGISLADNFGVLLTLPLRASLAVGSQAQVSIRANDIALSRRYIEGISIQNQLKGRICALITSGESLLVQVDCGSTLLVEITPAACKNMGLAEGEEIYCLIKTHSITHLSALASPSAVQVVHHGDSRYSLSEA